MKTVIKAKMVKKLKTIEIKKDGNITERANFETVALPRSCLFFLCVLYVRIKKRIAHCALLNKENRKDSVTSPHSSATLGAERSGRGP
jgi:hypothetical protein